jgi:hypothetical protein
MRVIELAADDIWLAVSSLDVSGIGRNNYPVYQ